jgi:hypothetical protein|nr:outer membrane beta-barrel protein [Kofleriaceae bacterium]
MRSAAAFILVASLTASLTAAADPDQLSLVTGNGAQPTYDIGFRVGGYGFRREGDKTPAEGWTECRMNGFGLFADRVVRGPIYVEAGLDAYSSSNLIEASPTTDLPIDRMSGLLSVAGGVRANLTPWLRGYVQLGAGVELTRVSVQYGDDQTIRDDKAMPMGFFGVGADLRVAKSTYVGATMRMLVMGNFDYDAMRLQTTNQWVTPPAPSDVFAASPDLAAQGQFYIRHDM